MRYCIAAFGNRFELLADTRPDAPEPVFGKHIKAYHSLDAARSAAANFAKSGHKVYFDPSLKQHVRVELSRSTR